MPRTSSLFSDLKYRLRAIFRRQAMETELADELQFHCEREAAKLVSAGVPARRSLAAGSPRDRRRRAGQRGMPGSAWRRGARVDGAGPPLWPAAAPTEAWLCRGRRQLAGAGHRRQHGHLQPHRRGPAPHAADRRPGRLALHRAPPDQRRYARVRVSRISSPAHRHVGTLRPRGLRIDPAQRKHRWQRRAHRRGAARVRKLLLAPRRACHRRAHDRAGRRRESRTVIRLP